MVTSTLELALHVPAEVADLATAWLFAAGAGGVEERDGDDGTVALVVYATDPSEIDAIAAHVTEELGSFEGRGGSCSPCRLVRGTVSVDWEREWLRHLRAVPLGDGFVAQPIDDDTALPQARVPLRFRPAWAFGDGTHPTTQLAAAAVERALRTRPGASLLDVGTGSGLLALLAVAAGARRVAGIDVDPKAIAAARENAGLNQGGERVDFSLTPLAAVSDVYAVVVANITETTLCELAPELARVTAPEGRLLLTGLVAGDTARLESLLAAQGLFRTHHTEQAEWTLLELERGSSGPHDTSSPGDR